MKILAIGAHLDDIETACGGLIGDAVEKSHLVKMVIMSDSSYTKYDGTIERTREEAYREGIAAAHILGVKDIEILDFPTKDVPYDSSSIEALDERVSKFKPDLILTHWPHDTHQSHKRTALATISACRYFNNILSYEPLMPSGRSYQGFREQLYFSVSKKGLKKKMEALRAHKSQYKKYGEKIWIGVVMARGIYRGYEIGVSYAECFEVMRWQLIL